MGRVFRQGDLAMSRIEQGDILSIEMIRFPVLVVSKNIFNRSEEIIGCPIMKKGTPDVLHIPLAGEMMEGVVLCEQVRLLDLRTRGFKKISRIHYPMIIEITDAIQSIFDH